MKKIKQLQKYILPSIIGRGLGVGLLLLCVFCVSCHDTEWDVPNFNNGAPYGNNSITEDNIITIAQLKAAYPKYAENYDTTQITTDCKLRVRVTGNDVQGNLYNSIAVQEDASGDALIIAIGGSDLYAFMPVGQELLVDLKGLYIGGYGSQPQIGMPYQKDSSSSPYVSRMTSSLWQQHVKLIGTADTTKVVPIEFQSGMDINTHCGKLMTIKNISIKGADGTMPWASKADAGTQTSVTKYFNELSTDYMVYTSTYADFANTPIPEGKMNLTGIWKQYNGKWELIIRDINDIEVINNEE